GSALDLGALCTEPLGPLVHGRSGHGLEGDVVEPDLVAVERLVPLAPRLAHPERAARAPEVPDRLALLALHLAHPVPPERAEQVAVERQAALDRGSDDIDVVEARGPHGQP